MNANRFLAKVLAVTLAFGAVGTVLPDTVSDSYSITASAEVEGPSSEDSPYAVNNEAEFEEAIKGYSKYHSAYVRLDSDIKLTNMWFNLGGNEEFQLTIDLNGHKLSRQDESNRPIFRIRKNATLNIKDKDSTGQVFFEPNDNKDKTAPALIENDGGDINIYGGSYENRNSDSTVLKHIKGTTRIYDGKFTSNYAPVDYYDGKLVIDGGCFYTQYGTVGSVGKSGFMFNNSHPNVILRTCSLECIQKTMSAYAEMRIIDTGASDGLTDYMIMHVSDGSECFGLTADTEDLNNTHILGKIIVIKAKDKSGDTNGDEKIDIEDAVTVINSINGVKPLAPTSSILADVDNNYTVDIEDAVSIINHVNGVKSLT